MLKPPRRHNIANLSSCCLSSCRLSRAYHGTTTEHNSSSHQQASNQPSPYYHYTSYNVLAAFLNASKSPLQLYMNVHISSRRSARGGHIILNAVIGTRSGKYNLKFKLITLGLKFQSTEKSVYTMPHTPAQSLTRHHIESITWSRCLLRWELNLKKKKKGSKWPVLP